MVFHSERSEERTSLVVFARVLMVKSAYSGSAHRSSSHTLAIVTNLLKLSIATKRVGPGGCFGMGGCWHLVLARAVAFGLLVRLGMLLGIVSSVLQVATHLAIWSVGVFLIGLIGRLLLS